MSIEIPLTVHQIWLGEDLPKEERVYIETAFKVCEKSGYKHKLWKAQDIISAFSEDDEVFYLWNKLWTVTPFPPILAAAVDYYKWKILATTPENERAVYIDADVEMLPRGKVKFNLPPAQTHISFGASQDPYAPSVAYMQVFGPDAAKLAVKEATKRLLQIDAYSRTFFEDFYITCADGKREGIYSLGTEWVRDNLLPALEAAELSAEIAPPNIFCQFGQYDQPLLLHHEKHYSTEGNKSAEELSKYKESIQVKVQATVKRYNEIRKRVIVLMSTARQYTNIRRTLNLISAEDIRNIQRKTTFAQAASQSQLDYYFVVGKSDIELSDTEKASPEFYYAPTPEDDEEHKYLAGRFYDAMKWVASRDGFDFLYFCEDDCYIHTGRLISLCSTLRPGDKTIYGNPDPENNWTHAGILVPVSVARKIIATDCDPPRPDESFGLWLCKCSDVVGGEVAIDEKFSHNKWQFPSPTNGRISTHDVNPYDLVALACTNESQKD